MEDIEFWVDFVARNSNKLQKLGLGGKINWAPKCVHTWPNGTAYTSLKWKKEEIFGKGRMIAKKHQSH